MNKLIISTVTILALCLCIGCTEQKNDKIINQLNNQTMEKQDKEQLHNLLMKYQEALNTSDADKAVILYTKDGIFMPSGAPSAIGTENIKGAYEFVFSNIQLNIVFHIEEIVIENNVAFAITTSKGSTMIHATGATVPEENRELFVFEKENCEWNIARYIFNKTK